MTRQTRLASLLGLGAALLLTSLSHAQPGSPPGSPAPGAAGGAAGAPAGIPAGAPASDLGTVSTESTFSQTTTTDTGTDLGATETLPKTGGEPLMLTLLGSLTAGSALLLRRKLS